MRRHSAHQATRLLLTALVSLAATGCTTTSTASRAPAGEAKPADAPAARGSEAWGVEPLAIRLSAAGHMLDFRMRVLDAEKAAPLLVRKTECYLIAEKSGQMLQVARSPKIGALRSTVRTEGMVKENRVYGALFTNHGKLVRAGDRVTVVMGDFRAEHLVVQ